jgi:DNA-binding Lrp family transcriptional regulator
MGVTTPAVAPLPDALDRELLQALAAGLPLVPAPYAALGAPLGLAEDEVLQRLDRLTRAGWVKRLGVVVRHHELGYRANAMVVWDVPDDRVERLGRGFGMRDFVTLCYRRPRRPPTWRYNLFTMIHGRDRDEVLARVEALARDAGADALPREVLFSRQRFKQRGARYAAGTVTGARRALGVLAQ